MQLKLIPMLGGLAATLVLAACSSDRDSLTGASSAGPLLSVAASSGTVVVQPTSTAGTFTQGWKHGPDRTGAVGSASLVTGPAAPPLGAGSLRLANSTFGYEAAGLDHPAFDPGTLLGTVTALSYATYTPSAQPGITVQHVSMQFTIDYDVTDATESFQGRLVYEPYLCNTTQVDAWQTWNTLDGAAAPSTTSGCWWQTANPTSSTRAPYVANTWQTGALPCPQDNPCTWAEVVAAYPTAGFHKTNGAKGLILKVGSTWTGTFHADAIVAGVGAGTPTTIDFEPAVACTTTCYVNAATGDDAFGGDTPGTAKKTVQAAIESLTPDGTVIVAAGTYAEAPQINKPLKLQGPNINVHPQTGSRGAEAQVSTITLGAGVDNVTIEGLRIATTGTAVGITSSVGASVHSGITIRYNDIAAATQPIRHGLGAGGGIGSANWNVSHNRISGISQPNATAIVMFNVTGVVIEDNFIRHDAAAVTGRRGMNLDGVVNAQILNNDIGLGVTDFVDATAASALAPWIIQLSMSDRPVSTVMIAGNTIAGGLTGISGLSQRNLSNVTISGNTITNVSAAVQFNNGGVAPFAEGTVMSGLTVTGNTMAAYRFGTRLRNLHAPGNVALAGTKPINFTGVVVSRNSFAPLAGLANNQVTGIFVDQPDAILIEGGVTGTVNGSCNFWNAASGPGAVASGSGLLVTARVVSGSWLETNVLTGGCVGGVPPVVSNVTVTPNPAPVTTASFTLSATATDNAGVTSAVYTIDGGAPVAFSLTAGTNVALGASFGSQAVGVYNICVTAKDAAGNTSNTECTMLAVYDPTAGFVTGGGWFTSPAGAYVASPSLVGRASFGFVSKYVKGRSVPTGNTEFQFSAGALSFSSTEYEWLVVNQGGATAQFKGTGTLNGVAGHRFMVWARDGAPDSFRIRISNAADEVVYDNGGTSAEFGTPIGGGNIVLHTPKR